jgi:hypothetical protein
MFPRRMVAKSCETEAASYAEPRKYPLNNERQ